MSDAQMCPPPTGPMRTITSMSEQSNVVWERDENCVAVWPECHSGGYDPKCCRFPKSCSCERPVTIPPPTGLMTVNVPAQFPVGTVVTMTEAPRKRRVEPPGEYTVCIEVRITTTNPRPDTIVETAMRQVELAFGDAVKLGYVEVQGK